MGICMLALWMIHSGDRVLGIVCGEISSVFLEDTRVFNLCVSRYFLSLSVIPRENLGQFLESKAGIHEGKQLISRDVVGSSRILSLKFGGSALI